MSLSDPIVLPLPDNPLAAKFATLHDTVKAIVVERDNFIHAAILAMVTETNLVAIGEPGVAKTFTIDQLVSYISNVIHFRTQFNNLSGLEDTFGPLDIPTFKATGAYVRRTDGYLPTAQLATLDEIFNGPESTLRALHAAVLEHKFNVDGKWLDIPLRTVFGLSNDIPGTPGTRAFYDRMDQRLWVDEIAEHENFVNMLALEVAPNPQPLLDWSDVQAAAVEIATVPVPRAILETLASIRRELRKENIDPSDRRFKRLVTLLQGEAWLEGTPEVAPEHLLVATNVLAHTKEQVPDVERVVLEHANPLQKEMLALLRDVEEISRIAENGKAASDKEQRNALGREAYQKCQRVHKVYKDLEDRAGSSRRQLGLLQTIKDKMHNNSVVLLEDVFDVQDGSVQLP